MNRFLSRYLLSILVAAAYGCGGGGSTGGEPAVPNPAEGIALEAVPPEDIDSANRLLVPSTFVVVVPRTDAPVADWTIWPESIATHVLDENNVYANSDQLLTWPVGGAGIYSSRADCSGYVTRSLSKAFNFTRDDFEAWMGSKGPSSARYHDNIVVQNNYQRISQASAVRRGDILAIKYLDNTGSGTGHTMVAASSPVQRGEATKPIVPNTVQYELRIIDSTSSPHSTGDTRKGTGAGGVDQDGAGLGTMRLYADTATGAITGYTWSLSSGSVYFTATSPANDRRSLVVGRMNFAQ